ncbi:MAG: hypothetical protein KC589_03085 [Nanoarchaeota archaeon]|nr:hypothetical protein [Nanoarchaeota archaeon]
MDFNILVKNSNQDESSKKFLKNPFKNIPSLDEALKFSKNYGIDLHPRYIYFWSELSLSQLVSFLEFLKKIRFVLDKKGIIELMEFPLKGEEKVVFENLGIEHSLRTVSLENVKSEEDVNLICLDKLNSHMLLVNLGFDKDSKFDLNKFVLKIDNLIECAKKDLSKSTLKFLNEYSESGIGIRDKGGSYIGARMGRPEKAKMRKQFNDETRSHGLFPVGEQGGRLKNIVEVLNSVGHVNSEFRIYFCPNCSRKSIYSSCEVCGSKNIQKYFEKYTFNELLKESEGAIYYEKTNVDMDSIIIQLRKILGSDVPFPKHVKGISSTINKHHTTEHIAKSFLREKNKVFVNKDGTVRYDMIEMGLTHFKAKEIGISIKKLKELGYTHDMDGKIIENDEQLIEIFPQDVILPDCLESGDEFASDYIINTGNYVDELLEKFYALPKFYNFKSKEDTIGHLIIGLAPHTSAGIVGRILGYSKTQGCFSHPVWHAAQRRNLDGDENGIMLLLDGLINFSREYLPDRRGSRTMDVSLVLTSHLYLDQIDDEVHGMDIVPYYPLEFYRANKKYVSPKSVKIEKVDARINKKVVDEKYLGYKFTHNTDNMNNTVLCSSYKSVPSMGEKLDLQLGLAKKLRAVDENQVGTFVIDKHFMKDIKGNLRKFSMQTFRCTNCGEKYRRPPLIGKCVKCKMPSINFTIHEGSIKKYVEPSFKIVDEYKIDPYIVETLELANLRIEGVFGKELEKQKSLANFFESKN